MKFVHIADMHFDAPFTSLNAKEDLGDKRRLEQRDAFKRIINYIKENEIDYLFIAGDLYEHEYVKKTTMNFISKCFEEISNTKIFITPGNHDPYIKNSFYMNYDFPDNVYIFTNSRLEKYEDDKVNIYGFAFTEFYMNESIIDRISIPESNKPNIFIGHVDLNGGKDVDGLSYNPILESKLNALNFDYVALGHIHKNNLDNKNRIYYPGSTISLGFDELGLHGMIVGELTKTSFDMQFVKVDNREFIEKEINVEEFNSKEELEEYILDLKLIRTNAYKIILVGKRNFEINSRDILRVVARDNILKVKDLTKLNYDVEEIAKQNTLKGIFIREVLKKYNNGECTEEEYQKAIEIGLEAM